MNIFNIYFFVNMMFLNFNNPLIMGILMLIQTLNLIFIMGKIYYSFWFSYIIFLVFVGGLFILFIYMISLTFNNKFFFINYKMYLILLMMMFMMMFLNKNIYYFFNNDSNYKLTNYNLMILSLKFFNFPNNFMNIMLIIYLLILMIIVVKITNFYKGPLKIKFYM